MTFTAANVHALIGVFLIFAIAMNVDRIVAAVQAMG